MTFRYNDLGKCYEEETIDSLAKATICLINYQYDTTSHPVMKTTKWSHGQNTIDYYNHRTGQSNPRIPERADLRPNRLHL